ncbi:MAG: DNA polymerase I [Candidatus Cloacimonetes bacterium]|nr:DNA polymerase I [Candidatus Cloacimonadota bacterium]
MSKIYLLDGTALIYRAYFAFINNPLRNSSGENTSAIFGVVNTLLKLINTEKPERIIVSFDLKEPTFRHEITDTYKANRPPAPEELISQIEPVKDFFKLLSIPEVSIPGFEADDILGTLAERLKDSYDIVIITSDKDFAQIVDDKVALFDPFSEKIVDAEQVKKKYGITPEQFADYLSIIGDSSDNIPGVRGIGPKGATTLLQQFNTLDDIYTNIEQISSESLRKKLLDGKESAYLSRRLARIVTDVPIEAETGLELRKLIEGSKFNEDILQKTIPYLQRYELNSILNKLNQSISLTTDNSTASEKQSETTNAELEHNTLSDELSFPWEKEESVTVDRKLSTSVKTDESVQGNDVVQLSFDFYSDSKKPEFIPHLIEKENDLKELLDKLQKKPIIAVAIVPSTRRGGSYNHIFSLDSNSSNGNDIDSDYLAGISICVENEHAYYIDLTKSMFSYSKSTASQDRSSFEYIPNLLTEIFSYINKEAIIVGHNIKHEYLILESLGITLREPLFDTMIASYLLDSALAKHNLIDCARRELHLELQPMEDILGTGKKKQDIKDLDIKIVAELANEDANSIFRLFEKYKHRLADNKLEYLFNNIEMPLLTVLATMERNGVYIDCDVLQDINQEISKEIDKLTESIYKLAGKEFNINSTQQLSKVMFDDLQIPPVKRTKTGYSTDNYVLEVLAEDFEIAQFLIDFRQLTKLRSTYVESLPQLVDKKTGRIHSSFNQTITTTGRLSSSNPNLQNIPIRSKAGKEIRKAFTVDDDEYLILSADYSQIELRILGILSKDRNLITAFNHDQDIHAQTAGLILNKPITMITQDERRMAKAINFGIIYGMGANKLSRETNISLNDAKEFIESYFTKFSRVKEYIQQQKYKARSYGYAETIMGRRLSIPNIHSSNQRLQSEAERIAVNMPIQGSAADIMKMAMIKLAKEFEKINKEVEKPLVRMIIQVHDELVFEVHNKELGKIRQIVIREMKNALPEKYRIIIPLAIDTGAGSNWFEAHS